MQAYPQEAKRWLAAKTGSGGADEWLPLWMHQCDTAGVMEYLWRRWLPEGVRKAICKFMPESKARGLCQFLGYTHDFGKASLHFQNRITTQLQEPRRRLNDAGLHISGRFSNSALPHAFVGEHILFSLGCPLGIAAVVGAHHGKPYAQDECKEFYLELNGEEISGHQKDIWEALWRLILEDALQRSDFNSIEDLPEIPMILQTVLSGLLVMADWIASNTYYFPLIDCAQAGDAQLYPERVDCACRTLALPDYWMPVLLGVDAELFATRFGFPPNRVQEEVLNVAEETLEPGLLILEAQMGVGKTEAALAAAECFAAKTGAGGLFFGLPTQATANGLFPRLRDWAEKQAEDVKLSIRLAHGQAELNPEYCQLLRGESRNDAEDGSGLLVHSFFQGRKQVLLSSFVVGTVDQLLMAALKQKHVFLRHLGLAGKVVVIDECHAYDAYMSRYLDRALMWLGAYKVPVIILSATLPAQRRADLVNAYLCNVGSTASIEAPWKTSRAYPLITWTDGGKTYQRAIPNTTETRKVSILRIRDEDRLALLKDRLQRGGCAAVILNTVRRAQDFARRIEEDMPEAELILFHSRFIATDRAALEQAILERVGKKSGSRERERLIVVGTQVLEQSLDIDVDIMLTDLCPMDLLLQRIGRLHRHVWHDAIRPPRLKAAVCCVIEDEECWASAKAVYHPWLLSRTCELLPDEVTLPGQISDLVQEAYALDPLPSEDEERKLREDFLLAQSKAKNKASQHCLCTPAAADEAPEFNLISGMLDNVVSDINDARAQATVRDGDESIDVLLLKRRSFGLELLSGDGAGRIISVDRVPSYEEKMMILRQRLRLPAALCNVRAIDGTLAELAAIKRTQLAEWEADPALAAELFLILDDEQKLTLGGYNLRYSKRWGLEYTKGGEENAMSGV